MPNSSNLGLITDPMDKDLELSTSMHIEDMLDTTPEFGELEILVLINLSS